LEGVAASVRNAITKARLAGRIIRPLREAAFL
jgi:hypothetical protein